MTPLFFRWGTIPWIVADLPNSTRGRGSRRISTSPGADRLWLEVYRKTSRKTVKISGLEHLKNLSCKPSWVPKLTQKSIDMLSRNPKNTVSPQLVSTFFRITVHPVGLAEAVQAPNVKLGATAGDQPFHLETCPEDSEKPT